MLYNIKINVIWNVLIFLITITFRLYQNECCGTLLVNITFRVSCKRWCITVSSLADFRLIADFRYSLEKISKSLLA